MENENSQQGFRGIPGVPDGWEVIEIRRGKKNEFVLDNYGNPYQLLNDSRLLHVIIRQIEAPKKYRHFANFAEYAPHADRKVSFIPVDGKPPVDGFVRVTAADDATVYLGDTCFSYKTMFESGRVFLDNGSPFGVEVKE